MIVWALCLLLGAPHAAASDSPRRGRVRHAPVENKLIEDQGPVRIAADQEWEAWISTSYPDNSGAWPDACAKSFAAREGGTWDFVAKADFNKNGAPTVLELRKAALPDDDFMVREFVIAQCDHEQWRELLRLDDQKGIVVGGVRKQGLRQGRIRGYRILLDTGTHDAPALRISADGMDAQGHAVTDGIDLLYDPASRTYSLEADSGT